MTQKSLLHRILEFCRGREFSCIDPIANEFSEAGYHAVETVVVDAIRRGLLRGMIAESNLIDGRTLIVSYIRG